VELKVRCLHRDNEISKLRGNDSSENQVVIERGVTDKKRKKGKE
jgi:hypothetical protein